MTALSGKQVEFILIGGMAAAIHGSARLTVDVDIMYSRNEKNLRALADALSPLNPYLRDVPEGLPFVLDYRALTHGLNFTLTTSAGYLDLLAGVPGGKSYEEVAESSVFVDSFGITYRCVSLEKLILLKQAAGRPKDLEVIAELKSLLKRISG